MNELALVNVGTVQMSGEKQEFPRQGKSVKTGIEKGVKIVSISLTRAGDL